MKRYNSCLKVVIIYFLLTVFMINCSQEKVNPTDIRKGEHIDRLGELVEDVASIIIDDVDRTHIDINPDINSTVLIDSDLIGNISDVELDGEYIYIADRQLHQIIRYNNENGLIEKTGQAGRGPGDFNEPTEVRINSQYIFVYEEGNARLQILTKEFEHVTTLETGYLSAGRSNTFDVMGEKIFIPSSSDADNDGLIQMYIMGNDIEKIKTFMTPLIPAGQQPRALNQTKIRTSNNYVFVSNGALPYIFIFDKKTNHIKTIFLEGKYVDDFYKNIPERVKVEFTEQKYVRSLIHSIDVRDDILYLLIKGDLIVIDLMTNKVLGSYRFRFNGEFHFGTLVRISDKRMYLIDPFINNTIIESKLGLNGKILNEAEFILY